LQLRGKSSFVEMDHLEAALAGDAMHWHGSSDAVWPAPTENLPPIERAGVEREQNGVPSTNLGDGIDFGELGPVEYVADRSICMSHVPIHQSRPPFRDCEESRRTDAPAGERLTEVRHRFHHAGVISRPGTCRQGFYRNGSLFLKRVVLAHTGRGK